MSMSRPGSGAGRTSPSPGAGGLRVGREAPLEARDLVAQGAAGSRLVATLERGDVVCLDGWSLQRLETRSLGVAAGIEDAGQVAGVDAGVAGGLRRRRGELFDRR